MQFEYILKWHYKLTQQKNKYVGGSEWAFRWPDTLWVPSPDSLTTIHIRADLALAIQIGYLHMWYVFFYKCLAHLHT